MLIVIFLAIAFIFVLCAIVSPKKFCEFFINEEQLKRREMCLMRRYRISECAIKEGLSESKKDALARRYAFFKLDVGGV